MSSATDWLDWLVFVSAPPVVGRLVSMGGLLVEATEISRRPLPCPIVARVFIRFVTRQYSPSATTPSSPLMSMASSSSSSSSCGDTPTAWFDAESAAEVLSLGAGRLDPATGNVFSSDIAVSDAITVFVWRPLIAARAGVER